MNDLGNSPALDTNFLIEAEDLEYAYETAVEHQLRRLAGMSVYSKRRATIRRLMEAEVDPSLSRSSVLGESGIVSSRIFYNTSKDWYCSPLFREVMENCLALAVRRDELERSRKERARRDALREMEIAVGDALFSRALDILKLPIEDFDGQPLRGITPQTAARTAVAASDLQRRALGMLKEQTGTAVFDVDIDNLTPEQIDRIAAGEDPKRVMGL